MILALSLVLASVFVSTSGSGSLYAGRGSPSSSGGSTGTGVTAFTTLPSSASVGASSPSGIGSVVSTVAVGGHPYGVGFDPGNGYVYVADDVSDTTGNVSVIDGTNAVATIPVGVYPTEVAYDSGNGYVYVTNLGTANVSVIKGTTVVGSVAVGSGPIGVVYDSGDGYVYVANGSDNVSVISGLSVVATIPVGQAPIELAYDSGNGYVYVTTPHSDNISVIDGRSVVATIPDTGYPYGIGYNAGNGYVYVGNQVADNITVINGTTVIGAIPLEGGTPGDIGYDSGNGYIYVAMAGPNRTTGNVTVIDNASVLGTIPVGGVPWGVGYDSSNAYVYVSNAYTGNVSVIGGGTPPPAQYAVSFAEAGLPSGTQWWVNGTAIGSHNSTGSTLSFGEPNGTYEWVPGVTAPFEPALSSLGGSVVVAGGAVAANVSFVCSLAISGCYDVEFVESGLPEQSDGGPIWGVTVNHVTWFNGDPTTTTTTFGEPSGSFTYNLSTVTWYGTTYSPTQSNGSFSVIPGVVPAATVDVSFSLSTPAYSVTFTTSPSDCGSVTFYGTIYTNGGSVDVPAGAYSVSATACSGYALQTITGTGSVIVSGSTATVEGAGGVTATFVLGSTIKYTVTFTTNPSTCGTITFNGTVFTSDQSAQVLAGSYPISVQACSGYALQTFAGSGSVSIGGSMATVSGDGGVAATFTSNSSSAAPGFLGLSGDEGYYILGGAGAAVVAVVAGILLARRSRYKPASSSPAPSRGGEPPIAPPR
jgi:YVTN family beta-propeller protein